MLLRRTICLSFLMSIALAGTAHAGSVGREQDHFLKRFPRWETVDDGTCPAGQVKEVRGAKMSDKGVVRTATCVPRYGPKTK